MGSFSFTQALEHAAMLATQALPEALHERISAAVILVRDGHSGPSPAPRRQTSATASTARAAVRTRTTGRPRVNVSTSWRSSWLGRSSPS